MSKSIFELVDNLPKKNITTMMLNSLDFAVPGQWQNLVGFENTIRHVSGESDQEMIQQIGDRAVWLFNDKSQGYQKALWLYQTVDNADNALGTAALANKVGDKIPLVGGLLSKVTPDPDKAQTIDLCIKLVIELVAFCQINGIPGDSINDFVSALGDYGGESLMRMAALIAIDGLIPIGPDFIQKAQSSLGNMSPKELESNSTFKAVKDLIPGKNSRGQLEFIGTSFGSVKDWMINFVNERNLTQGKVFERIKGFVDVSEDKLDYVAAFLDMTTNYYEHTGTQTLAVRLIERAYAEI